MNILHTESIKNKGGQQNKIMNEMRFMRELGHNVSLFAQANSDIAKQAIDENFNVIECEMLDKNYFRITKKLLQNIKDSDINLVIAHSSIDGWAAAFTGLFLRKRGVKFYRERHNSFIIKSFISKFMHAKMFDLVLTVSEANMRYLSSIGIKKLFYLPSAINTKSIPKTLSNLREEFNISNKFITVGMFSKLKQTKGVYEFAKALKIILEKHKNVIGIFGGSIDHTTKSKVLENFTQELQQRIIFTGYRSDNANVIGGMDIFVFPSHTEGLPNVLLEAMILRRPIVAFDIEPMNDLLKDERGICVHFKDENALANAIDTYINNEPLCKKYGENSFKYVSENFDLNTLKENIKRLLND
ncbi:glycosyltransferase [Campylobacter mucosalis]|uniref:glycosyltransferase n=1 Tax=Campylobacter mucosalis TaxID=202 RepID=UPI0014705223